MISHGRSGLMGVRFVVSVGLMRGRGFLVIVGWFVKFGWVNSDTVGSQSPSIFCKDGSPKRHVGAEFNKSIHVVAVLSHLGGEEEISDSSIGEENFKNFLG